MFEKDGKRYTTSIKDFANENGVSVRTVQKKLTAERYQKDLKNEFLRTNANGTWLTDEACIFLKSTFKTQAVGFVSDAKLEAEIKELKDKLLQAKDRIIDLQDERDELRLSAKRVPELEASNSEKDEKIAELRNELKTRSKELDAEKSRKLTLKEWWSRRK